MLSGPHGCGPGVAHRGNFPYYSLGANDELEEEVRVQIPLQGHIPNDLTSFH